MSDEDPDPLDPRSGHPAWDDVPPAVRHAALKGQGKRALVFEEDGMSDGVFHVDPRAFSDTDG
jgi:hypothetical protein